MPVQLTCDRILTDHIDAAGRGLVGMWICSASPIAAEICAGAGLDLVLIDAEHCPNDLSSLLAQLHAVSAYPVTTLVRVPLNDERLIKQYLDLGVINLLVPMVHTPDEARQAAARVDYPSRGVRGVGSALARASRWNRVPNYLETARSTLSLTVQIESDRACSQAEEIAAVEGVDALFVGPADLAADLGIIGQAEDARVVDRVMACIAAGHRAGKPVGTNAFNPTMAKRYLDAGADFVFVNADVTVLARGSEKLAEEFLG
ncbi:2-dehydro-3-deoxyglucarate aldolase [Nanchangia anserum]|uniref:2-dehydro-3-deoxyglucarate aldolase n=1 Tax=Nanchangia anserum TaxID=2692125 RepID=A0A8I0GE64_9ACTO|nr:aldolase/citrate lyase family protein [Nanchangia anserum]MBD3689217.1 2-dehydro-3-deoxyglucarate aldolase [Nanchangia anserum]QOX81441.1 2-dehydro-3-deoxyglucarate aldolase [Nanchangia anserum]